MAEKFHRPNEFAGKADKYLPQISAELGKLLRKAQKKHEFQTIKLSSHEVKGLAPILTELGEDLYFDIGIWKSMENYNLELFGNPLPFLSQEKVQKKGITPDRVQYFLWVVYSEFFAHETISPNHLELQTLGKLITEFLESQFSELPSDSGAKNLMEFPVEKGWDMKRKLVWLGQSSYLFRPCFSVYIEKQGGKVDIPTIDDFICQETSIWSGLGAIDVLAGMLDSSEEQKEDLRSWYERHMAIYEVTSSDKETIEATNLINDQNYKIRVGLNHPFYPPNIIFGSLVPWDGEWYWSGQQQGNQPYSEKELEKIKEDFFQRTQGVICRYDKEFYKDVSEELQKNQNQFLEHYQKPLTSFSDGASFKKSFQEFIKLCKPELEMEAADIPVGFPDEVLKCETGVGVFFNPKEGLEMMQHFNVLISGLQKQGKELTEEEESVVKGFVYSQNVSHLFVNEVVQEYGDASIAAAFSLQEEAEKNSYWLDYLLRSTKGFFFRNRYPSIATAPS